MNRSDDLLFSKKSLNVALRGQLASISQEMDAISKDQFQANSDEQVTEHIFSKMVISTIVIYRDQITRSEPRETKFQQKSTLDETIQVPSVEMVLSIPYTGESDLWVMQPSTYTHNPPRGSVEPNRRNDQEGVLKIRLEYYQQEFQSDKVNQEIEKAITSIEQFLEWIKRDIEAHNKQLKNEISRLVSHRRERLGTIQEVAKTLNIPIKKREGAPDATPLPIHRKQIKPLASKEQQEPSYGISEEDYQAILKIVRHEGATYERTPKTYAMHNEEELRDILLAHLNGHFEGQASGETFRKKGKTDIAIEFENRAAFIAECKVWHGEKLLLEAVNQLLGYLTWRDVKTALVIYNKEVAGFKGIQEKLPEIFQAHPNFISIEPTNGGGEWRLRLRSEDDEERYILVHIFLFNLFVKP
jgi:hypothetical protein